MEGRKEEWMFYSIHYGRKEGMDVLFHPLWKEGRKEGRKEGMSIHFSSIIKRKEEDGKGGREVLYKRNVLWKEKLEKKTEEKTITRKY